MTTNQHMKNKELIYYYILGCSFMISFQKNSKLYQYKNTQLITYNGLYSFKALYLFKKL